MGSNDMSIRTRNEKKADDIAEALRQDNISLQTSGRIMAENLEVLRGHMTEITLIVREALPHIADVNIADDFRKILSFSDSDYAGPAA
jgi:hypothetical protein